jgi:hypothetical protein
MNAANRVSRIAPNLAEGICMSRRTSDLVLSVIAAAIGMALSWPFWRDFHYWPVSHAAWYVYFALGFVLAIYVFHVFLGVLRTLFEHDALARESSTARGKENAP